MSFIYVVVVPYLEELISSFDIKSIGMAIERKDPQLLWKPVNLRKSAERDRFRMPGLPSILFPFHGFSTYPLPQYKGVRLSCGSVHKVKQLRILESAGIRVPKWTRLSPTTEIDPAEFGENLIIKPTETGASLGRGVTLIKTSGFSAYRDEHAAQYLSLGRSAPLVQQHIRTGDRAEHNRILVFLDRVLLSKRNFGAAPTTFNAPANDLVLLDNVASNAKDGGQELLMDDELDEFGLKIHAAFDATCSGVDILRSSDDGQLYALEVNIGNTWQFSCNVSVGVRAAVGVENMRAQHDVYEVASEAIIDRARTILKIS